MPKAGYAVCMEPSPFSEGKRPVVVLRHNLPPHDVVERLSFQTVDHMRAVAFEMLAQADVIDTKEGQK